MGKDVEAALSAIDETRARLDADLDALFSRAPSPDQITSQVKIAGAVLGGVVAAAGAFVILKKSRAEEKQMRRQARINAEELARSFAVQGAEAGNDDGRNMLPLALGAAAAGVAGGAVLYGRSRDQQA